MRREKPQIRLLCEDIKHRLVIQHFLKAHGIDARKMRVNMSPSSGGAAAQYIRENFPGEVVDYRSMRNYRNVCLIVMIDADPGNTLQDRKDMLRKSLRDAGKEDLRQDDRVAILVPKRNIETWMHFLTDHDTDEQTDYKQSHPDSDCKRCGRRLKDIHLEFRGETRPRDLPESLATACHELERICRCE